jgi:hypothetical protein
MRRRALLRLLGSTPLADWLRPWLQRALGADDANAADVYQPAFAWAARLGTEDRARLRDAATRPLDDPAVSLLIERARPALEAIRRAATIDRCHWTREVLTDDDLNQDQLSVFNLDAIRVACLSARREAHRGRVRAALDEVFAALSLAHRIGTGGVIMARVFECSGEAVAIQALGGLLTDLDPRALDDLARRFDALPAPEPASATIIGPEERYIRNSLRTKVATRGPVFNGDDWPEAGFQTDVAAALQPLTGDNRARILAHLEATGPAFAELARRLDLPRQECRAALDEFAKQSHATQPIVASLVDAAWGCRNVVDRMLAFRAMLHAGIALVGSGEAAFRAVADPFGTGPFGLDRLGRGFRIRSALSVAGSAPVTLTIGGG